VLGPQPLPNLICYQNSYKEMNMNQKSQLRPRQLFTSLGVAFLLLLCLLFLVQGQLPAYSQELPSAVGENLPAEVTPTRIPCPPDPTPPAPGETVRIVGDDEILLSFRQASDSMFLINNVLDNPLYSTAIEPMAGEGKSIESDAAHAVDWLTATSGDLDGDGRAEIVSAYRSDDGDILRAYSNSLSTPINLFSWHSDERYRGGNVHWVDVATGDLDRQQDDDEVVTAFQDDYDDIHVEVRDAYGPDSPGAIGNQLANWWKDDLQRGDVDHVTVATGDLDGDGVNDEIVIAFKDSGSDLNVEILQYNGAGAVEELWRINSKDYGRGDVADDASGSYKNKWPIDVSTGDLDGDMMDEVILAFRIGDKDDGSVQLWALDVTDAATWTVDSSVWWNHAVPDAYRQAATAVAVSAADLDGDGADEIALAYNFAQTDLCEGSSGSTYVCNTRWLQQMVTYEYTPFAAAEYSLCPSGSSYHGCFRQRSGTWTSSKNTGRDTHTEGAVAVATGDLDRDTKEEIALAHYKWETDDLEVLSFDADSALSQRAVWSTDLGLNRPAEFSLAMGDRDGDSRYATYTDVCYRKTEAQVVSAIYAPPHWPEEHVAANEHHAGASFDAQADQASGESTEVSSAIGGSVKVSDKVHDVGASFTYGWEKEAFAGKSQTISTESGLKYSTCPPLFCEEEAFFNAVQIVETTFNCFVYTEAEAGDMDVCLQTYTRKLPYSQQWWYTTGHETYPESWIPLGHNLALGRSATQSSEDPAFPAPASRSVDGDANGEFGSGHVSHTGYAAPPHSSWWQVDLGGVQWLGVVQVWNRTDFDMDRLKDFYVFISEEPFDPEADLDTLLEDEEIWNTFIAGEAGRPTIVPVDHHGRYLRVQLQNANYLDMSELQVYGMPGAVDQWPMAEPASSNNDAFTLTWRDPNLAGGELVQTIPGQLLVVDADKTSVAASTTLQESSIGFGQENETITGNKTAEKMSVGLEVQHIGGEVSTTSTQKVSYALSWGNKVGFFGEVAGLPPETNPPTMEEYQYDFAQYAWLQRVTSSGGVSHAFLVGGYWVPQIGPFAALGAPPPPVTGGPSATPATPRISSTTHSDPDEWVASDSATFTWKQPGGDSTAISGYTWRLDQTADTIPYEVNRGLVTTKTFDVLADGIWYLHVRAMSTGGQWSETAHRAIRVDVTAPQVMLNLDPGQPSGDSGWYMTPVTVTVDAVDGAGGGVTKIEVRTNGATWQPYTTPLIFTDDTAGTTVYARAIDAAGHVSEPFIETLKIDQTAPDSHVDGGAGPGAWVAEIVTDEQGNEALVLAGAVTDDLSGHSSFSLQYDGLDWTGASETGSWYPFPDQPQIEANWKFTATHEIGAGYHIFMGRAQDMAGNQEEAYEIARVLWLPRDAPDIQGSSVTASNTAVRPGEEVIFSLVARNNGAQDAYVAISDTLPVGLSPVLETLPAEVNYDPDTRTLTWPARLLWPGQHRQHIFQATADADLQAMTLENEAAFHASWPNTDLLSPAERQPFLDREQTATATASIMVDPLLSAGSDRTRPWALLLPRAQAVTIGPQVELGIPAAGDVRLMLLREWAPDPDTGAWVVMQDSGWLPYKRTTSWTLSPGQGVKYLGVWVADGSGNISVLNEHALAFVNRMDSSQALADGQRIQYRAFLEEGTEMFAALKTLSGDPDMRIWRPRNAFWPDRYSDAAVLPGQVENLGYEQLEYSGRYLLEVQAIGASEYELILNRSRPQMGADMTRHAQAIKPQPEHPLVISDPLSANQVGASVEPHYRFYLPVMLR
jgi:uncharacterized repeat protein (TIGR01451 family)